jgi:hypothetical protein
MLMRGEARGCQSIVLETTFGETRLSETGEFARFPGTGLRGNRERECEPVHDSLPDTSPRGYFL